MNILIAIDYNRRVIRFAESSNVYYSIRSLIQRDKFSSENIYQSNSVSKEAIKIMFTLLADHRARRNSKDYGKEYKLDSYRVRIYCMALGHKIPYFDIDRNEYDLLTCRVCKNQFQAVYETVDNIYRLNEIIMKDNYCSKECERFRDHDCLICGKKITSTYTTCSAKCEMQYRLQKNNMRNTNINKPIQHIWNTESYEIYYCKNCDVRISNKKSKDFCSLDCRLEYRARN